MKFETPEQLRGYLKSLPHLNDKVEVQEHKKLKKIFIML